MILTVNYVLVLHAAAARQREDAPLVWRSLKNKIVDRGSGEVFLQCRHSCACSSPELAPRDWHSGSRWGWGQR